MFCRMADCKKRDGIYLAGGAQEVGLMSPHSWGDAEGCTAPSRRTRVATVDHFR